MKEIVLQQLVDAIKSVLLGNNYPIVLHEPVFGGNEVKYVKECIDTGWVSSVGKYVDRFEKDIADFTGAKYAVAAVNGTAALHASFLLANIQPQDEVLVPSLTFVATCNAIAYCNAIPHFVDSCTHGLGVDHLKLADYLKDIAVVKSDICINTITKRPIKALCVVHVFGHPVDLDPIHDICGKYHITLIEDAAEALGSYYKESHVGYRGLCGVLSFNGNKIITTGGGGIILTDNEEFAKNAKHVTTTAKLPHDWLYEHDRLGYNYRLPNINAAMGCAQLEQIPQFLEAKRQLAEKYREAFSGVEGVEFVVEPEYAKSNYWLHAIRLKDSSCRDELLRVLNTQGIGARPVWNLMHTLNMYKECPKMDLSAAEEIASSLVNLPSSANLK